MQGKGIVKFFLVVMTIVTLWQYFLIIPTNKVENDAKKYAKKVLANSSNENPISERSAISHYLDSMSSEEILKIPLLKSYTYQELKGQQLALGLDLKGGMSVVLQVDLRDFIRTLANDSKDPTFKEALKLATEAQKDAQTDYVTLFSEAWAKIANGKKMASIFRKNEALSESINSNTSDADVTSIIRKKADETVDLTFKLLKERIDKLGVTQPNVSLDKARDLIVVELPGIDNPKRARAFLSKAAKLEFWDVYRISDPGVQQKFVEANEKLKKMLGGQEEVEKEFELIHTYATDSLGNVDSTKIVSTDTVFKNNTQQGPLFDRFQLNDGSLGLAVMGTAEKNEKNTVLDYLSKKGIKEIFPQNMIFKWSKDPIKDYTTGEFTNTYELFAIKAPRGGSFKAPLSGDHVTNATASPNSNTGEVEVSLKMDNAGTKIWGQMTTRANNDKNREIAIVLDDEVVSAPRVNSPILGGSSSITGNFNIQEGKDLANILQIGKLPARTQIIQESLVGPTLGESNIQRSKTALIIGFLLVLAFMVFYYTSGGLVAIISLLLNIFFIFGALASMGTVLTLPGLAGVVLTIGMAVDANVIIFERIREELRRGKKLSTAINDGFKYSYSAIIDANVTTILVAIILFYFGLGPIKGFAAVLIVGVLSSLFTAVLVGKLAIDYWIGKGKGISFSSKMTGNIFSNLSVDWMKKRKIAYFVSGAIILAGLISMFTRGFDLGIDFKGGYSYNIEFADDVSATELRESLTKAFESVPVVKAVDSENTFNVVTEYLVDDTDEDAAQKVFAKLYEGVKPFSGGVSLEQFGQTDAKGVTHITSSSKVGPTIADDIQSSSYKAIIFSLILIFLYIFIRFSKWQYSLGAVVALFHDVLVVLGLFSLLHGLLPFTMEIDQAFIAAILTVVGYSINDTVVIFDRIREYFNTYTKLDKTTIINNAISSTISRTLITSLTTFFVVAVLFVFGGGSIKGFAFALLIGIIVGTYSSIFIASPVMSDLSGDMKPAAPVKKKGFTRAKAKL